MTSPFKLTDPTVTVPERPTHADVFVGAFERPQWKVVDDGFRRPAWIDVAAAELGDKWASNSKHATLDEFATIIERHWRSG